MIKAQQTRFHASIQFLLLGWFEGERLRDGERGWFLAECVEPITCQATIQRNMQRMDRLQGLETNVWIGWAVFWRHGRLLELSWAQLLRRPFVMPVTQKNEFSNKSQWPAFGEPWDQCRAWITARVSTGGWILRLLRRPNSGTPATSLVTDGSVCVLDDFAGGVLSMVWFVKRHSTHCQSRFLTLCSKTLGLEFFSFYTTHIWV